MSGKWKVRCEELVVYFKVPHQKVSEELKGSRKTEVGECNFCLRSERVKQLTRHEHNIWFYKTQVNHGKVICRWCISSAKATARVKGEKLYLKCIIFHF